MSMKKRCPACPGYMESIHNGTTNEVVAWRCPACKTVEKVELIPSPFGNMRLPGDAPPVNPKMAQISIKNLADGELPKDLPNEALHDLIKWLAQGLQEQGKIQESLESYKRRVKEQDGFIASQEEAHIKFEKVVLEQAKYHTKTVMWVIIGMITTGILHIVARALST